jgi:hypothetical protein
MFNFSFEKNDTRQFLWMSWGGILVPWALVLLTPLLVPIDNASRALLLATFVTRAVQISMFEVPVVMRTRRGGEPRAELGRQLVRRHELAFDGTAVNRRQPIPARRAGERLPMWPRCGDPDRDARLLERRREALGLGAVELPRVLHRLPAPQRREHLEALVEARGADLGLAM